MQEIRVGLHNIVKLILNALWGKFAQNEDRVEIFYVKTYEELSTFLENPVYEDIHFDYFDHNVIRVAARKKVSHIACFARLRLYNALISLPRDSVSYFDTDSIIYYSENGKELIECGSFVGQLKNELSHGEYTTEFCSTGPKCYSYLTNKDREIVHVEGFKLSNVNVKKLLTHELMNIVVNDSDIFVDVKENQIVKNDKLYVFTKKVKTKFGYTFDKRVVRDDFSSVPFGYVE